MLVETIHYIHEKKSNQKSYTNFLLGIKESSKNKKIIKKKLFDKKIGRKSTFIFYVQFNA